MDPLTGLQGDWSLPHPTMTFWLTRLPPSSTGKSSRLVIGNHRPSAPVKVLERAFNRLERQVVLHRKVRRLDVGVLFEVGEKELLGPIDLGEQVALAQRLEVALYVGDPALQPVDGRFVRHSSWPPDRRFACLRYLWTVR